MNFNSACIFKDKNPKKSSIHERVDAYWKYLWMSLSQTPIWKRKFWLNVQNYITHLLWLLFLLKQKMFKNTRSGCFFSEAVMPTVCLIETKLYKAWNISVALNSLWESWNLRRNPAATVATPADATEHRSSPAAIAHRTPFQPQNGRHIHNISYSQFVISPSVMRWYIHSQSPIFPILLFLHFNVYLSKSFITSCFVCCNHVGIRMSPLKLQNIPEILNNDHVEICNS